LFKTFYKRKEAKKVKPKWMPNFLMPLRGQQNLTNLGAKPKEPKPNMCRVEQTISQKPIGKQNIKGG
jgi:hypothetical protein